MSEPTRKILVALTRDELDWLEAHLEERGRHTVGAAEDGVSRAVRNARRIADGEGPLYPSPKGRKW